VDLGLEADELDMKPPASIIRLTLAALATVALCASTALGSTELVKNGLLTEGRDGKPSHWRTDMYAADASRMTWTVGNNGLGVLEIDSSKPNDARWVQNVPVSPNTWYQVTGWLRAEDVGGQAMGVYLSVMDTFHNSRDLRGTSGWQPVSFWVKTGGLETSLQLACRLGGYSSLNTGRGWCAGLSVAAAGAPQARDPFVYGGTVSGESSGSKDLPIAQGVAVLVVIGILLLAWRYLAPPSARIPR
jgi:dolichyl-phosphate-mannose-protein mannosyltransferase